MSSKQQRFLHTQPSMGISSALPRINAINPGQQFKGGLTLPTQTQNQDDEEENKSRFRMIDNFFTPKQPKG